MKTFEDAKKEIINNLGGLAELQIRDTEELCRMFFERGKAHGIEEMLDIKENDKPF